MADIDGVDGASVFDPRRELFPELDPPPHGLLRLRARLDARNRRRYAVGWVPVGIAVAACAALVVRAALEPAPPTLRIDAGIAAWVDPPSEPVSLLPDADGAVLEPVPNPSGLVWYRVAGVRRVATPD